MPAGAPDNPLQKYVNRSVRFRFDGIDFRFNLSHALFSSYDIDDGTRLLLKTIAERLDLSTVRSVLDVGCGVGVLGICVGARAPHASILMQDRDALAAAFAAENASLNGRGSVGVEIALGFDGPPNRRFDLIVSNLPAKAGRPVLESFFRKAAARLRESGTAAFVIVRPLAEFARSTAEQAGLEVTWAEENARYTVLHTHRGALQTAGVPDAGAPPGSTDIAPYIRARATWSCAGTTYEAETAYSLPDFDTLGHSVENAMTLLSQTGVRGEVMVWNPGQGHVPLFLVRRAGRSLSGISLAARDALELAMTERNLRTFGLPPRSVSPAPSEVFMARGQTPGQVDLLCASPHAVPRVPWQGDLLGAAMTILKPHGRLLVSATSTDVQRLLAARGGFRLVAGRKHAGHRVVLLERP